MRVALNLMFVGGGVAGGRVYGEGLLRGFAAVSASTDEFVSFVRRGVSLPPLPPRFAEARAPVSGESILKRTLWEYFRLPGAVRRGRFDVFHALGSVSPVPPRGTPFVLTIHDQIYRHFPTSMPFGHRWFTRLVQPRVARRADRVVVDSRHVAREVVEILGVRADRVRVVPLGSGQGFHPVTDESAVARARARYGVRAPYVIAVGRGYPHKNLAGLLRAFALVRSRHPNVQLVLVGDRYLAGAPLDQLTAALGLSGAVVWTGFIAAAELSALYSGAASFAFPSLAEGFGLPVLEAMSAGVPVVASNLTSVPEVVGDAGLLVDPRDPEAFAAALGRVLVDEGLRAGLRSKALARVKAFTWERCAAETLAVYRELA